jgi:hypothetical protein
MKKYQKKTVGQLDYYTRISDDIRQHYRDVYMCPEYIRDYISEAILSAFNYRGVFNHPFQRFYANSWTLKPLVPFFSIGSKISSYYGVSLEIDPTLADGEIRIDEYIHHVWPRNLKFSDFWNLGD